PQIPSKGISPVMMRGAIMLALPNKSVASLLAHLGQQYPDELAEFRARLVSRRYFVLEKRL
ncbi:hypothetical protein Ciccas_006415, partial [Cichlidogyrus casuarinus]